MQVFDKTAVVKPFIKWVGGKVTNLPKLMQFVPDTIDTYVEPFVGCGAMYFGLKFNRAIINDINAELICAYRQVRDHTAELKALLNTFRYEKEQYLMIRSWDREPDFLKRPEVERAARLIYLIKTGYNGLYRVNKKNFNNVPLGRYEKVKICDEERLDKCSLYLRQHETEICNQDYYTLLDKIPPNAFVYLDPPYHPLTGTAKFTSYMPGVWAETEQRRLGEFCRELDRRGIKFMQTNSTAPLLYELYRGFNMTTVDAKRNINSDVTKRQPIKELVITNY
ncbi:MAG: Dam family site-specific DNA-(adenine-N6)-methyltransferase [Succinivibrio sp.]|nr:Dam family site-specific DNA-(adenine-N6)-methyltransferase [Succinivibrio sp.]